MHFISRNKYNYFGSSLKWTGTNPHLKSKLSHQLSFSKKISYNLVNNNQTSITSGTKVSPPKQHSYSAIKFFNNKTLTSNLNLNPSTNSKWFQMTPPKLSKWTTFLGVKTPSREKINYPFNQKSANKIKLKESLKMNKIPTKSSLD